MDVEDTQVEVNETEREVEAAEQMLKMGEAAEQMLKMGEPFFVFLDFKEDKKKILNFRAVLVSSRRLFPSHQFGFYISSTLEEHYNTIYETLDQKVWIGHDLLTSDWPRLRKECQRIDKEPPKPKLIIDTAPFIWSEMKLDFIAHVLRNSLPYPVASYVHIFFKKHMQLVKLAVLFGLGEATGSSYYDNCQLNINAIKKCGVAMSILDIEEKEKDSVPKIHPMIRHLMKFQDYNYITWKEAIHMWKEEFFKFLAEGETSQDVGSVYKENEASMEMLKKEPSVVIFDFKEDDFGMLRFGGSVLCSKTLSPYGTVLGFCIQATDSNGKPTSKTPDEYKHGPTLEEYCSRVYNMLDQKVWIGHGLRESWPTLHDEFVHIGKEPPRPKIIIDTAPFIRSHTKLARLAVLLGLGKETGWSFHSHLVFLNAIEECREAMSILDMEMEQPEIHPMISHLTKFQQLTLTYHVVTKTRKTRNKEKSERKKRRKLKNKEAQGFRRKSS